MFDKYFYLSLQVNVNSVKYMKRFLLVFLLVDTIVFVGCDRKMKPQEIFDQQKSGVVLICNEYYYELTLPNGESFYFSTLDDENGFINLTSIEAEIKKTPSMLNGTGFFIDSMGRILTNRHVVAPQIDKEAVRKNINTLLQNYSNYLEQIQDSLNEKYSAIKEYAASTVYQDVDGDTYTTLDDSEIENLRMQLNSLQEQYQEAEEYKQNLRKNLLNENFRVKLHSHYGIVYDGNKVNGWRDFMKNPCVLLRTSQDAGSDLALLQLKTGRTPRNLYIFVIDEKKMLEDGNLKINQQLYMIGYNSGVMLAKTNNGISAQFTNGTVTQRPDGNRVMYSIPTMQGSSGSPVVNEYGRVVAVNFAKAVGSDNFNFGIPLARIITFLK